MRPLEALAHAATLLEAQGFAIVARNERGDSLYFARAGSNRTLRLSNHARKPRQRLTHPEVATSLVIYAPRSPVQIAEMVARTIRTFEAEARD